MHLSKIAIKVIRAILTDILTFVMFLLNKIIILKFDRGFVIHPLTFIYELYRFLVRKTLMVIIYIYRYVIQVVVSIGKIAERMSF